MANVVSILQPSYLGWCGFFDLIDQSDTTVLLDTVPLSKQSWQTRNRILGRDGNVVWLSIPIQTRRSKVLRDTMIAETEGWRRKHTRTLMSAYRHTDHFDTLYPILELYQEWSGTLTGFTTKVLVVLCEILGITTPINVASGVLRQFETDTGSFFADTFAQQIAMGPIERIEFLCKQSGATEFLEPAGGRELFQDAALPVPVRFHEYEPQPYEQNGGPFVSHLSVVDCLARHGPEATMDVIRAGRNVPV